MCGRYSLSSSTEELIRELRIQARFEVFENYQPRYNVAPGQNVLVVGERSGQRAAAWHRWGLIPRWAKDHRIGNRMINARAETVAEKPAFRSAFQKRRCLVPADGFYEWRNDGKAKIPFRFLPHTEALFAFAGLWEEWRPPSGDPIRTCTIITTTPNEQVRDIHDRMPVILPPEAYDDWLNPESEIDHLLALLRPYPSEQMRRYEVSRRVGSPQNDDPSLIEPV